MLICVSPHFRAQVSSVRPAYIACAGSTPSNGERVLVEESSVIAWLLRMRTPASREDTIARAAAELNLDADGAECLVRTLVEAGLLVSEDAAHATAAARAWEDVGWRDALDFHLATSNLRFEPDYDQYRARMTEYLREGDETGDPQPPAYKEISAESKRVALSARSEFPALSLADVYRRRHPFSGFAARSVPLSVLGSLIYASFGETGTSTKSLLGLHLRKTSPSGGARHPIEVYVAAFNVTDLEPGLYLYSVQENALVEYRLGDLRKEVVDVCFQKSAIATAGAVFFYAARWHRHMWKYRYGRSYRMVLMDVGHIAETQILVGAAFGLATFSCPSFHDENAGELLTLDDNLVEGVVHVSAIGYPT